MVVLAYRTVSLVWQHIMAVAVAAAGMCQRQVQELAASVVAAVEVPTLVLLGQAVSEDTLVGRLVG